MAKGGCRNALSEVTDSASSEFAGMMSTCCAGDNALVGHLFQYGGS
jgi:hypothetical protein